PSPQPLLPPLKDVPAALSSAVLAPPPGCPAVLGKRLVRAGAAATAAIGVAQVYVSQPFPFWAEVSQAAGWSTGSSAIWEEEERDVCPLPGGLADVVLVSVGAPGSPMQRPGLEAPQGFCRKQLPMVGPGCCPPGRGPQAGQCLRFWLMQPCSVVFPAEWLPRKAENLTPYTMALIAKYVARHRLREPRLLDTIANFLLKRGEQLESKVIQKLVFPFSRMNYRPSNHSELFPKLEAILEQKAASSPLATVNILMSMFQLRHFPQAVLHQVFSPAFITNVMSSPYALIVRRYLSLLDAALELEFRDYSGPRLDPRYRVLMFDHALTADEANRKYSYKGLVAEALRQLVGEECYRQDEVLPPGYCTGNVPGGCPEDAALPGKGACFTRGLVPAIGKRPLAAGSCVPTRRGHWCTAPQVSQALTP
uniref:Fas activated serine/threonine kinase n=1 Tax=Chelydra serpentina TaxID=8475 RepID=A0A8C3SE74_CHESE